MQTNDTKGDTADANEAKEVEPSAIGKLIKKFDNNIKPKKMFKKELPFFSKTAMVKKPFENKLKKENLTLKNIDLSVDLDFTLGTIHYIEVQPDFRYPLLCFSYTVKDLYPSILIEEVKKFSIMELIGISQIFFTAHILHQDMIAHSYPTKFTSPYVENAIHKTHLSRLLNFPIPEYLRPLLMRFTSTRENLMTKVLFVPSLSASDFQHDYGRLMPYTVLIALHNTIATMDSDQTIDDLFYRFFTTVIITINNVDYTVSNFIGAVYNVDEAYRIHNSWIIRLFQNLLYDAFNTSIPNNRNGMVIPLNPPVLAAFGDFNPYTFLLGVHNYADIWIDNILDALDDVYISNPALKGPTILELTKAASTNSTVVHVISDFCQPTWHHNMTTLREKTPLLITERTSAQFCEDLHLIQSITPTRRATPYESSLPTVSRLVLVTDHPQPQASTSKSRSNNNNELQKDLIRPYFSTFNQEKHIFGDVLIMNPYNEPSEVFPIILSLGLRIENPTIDAIGMPIVHPLESTVVTNSQYTSGIVHLSRIAPVKPSSADDFHLYVQKRHRYAYPTQGIILYDMSRNIIPRLARAGISVIADDERSLPSFLREEHHIKRDTAANVFTQYLDQTQKLPKERIVLWSSYRYIRTTGPNQGIYLYPSLRPFFGTTIPYSLTSNIEHQAPS